MTLTNIFSKPVDRTIEGVIKADDETSLRLEIEEYVLTNEVEQRLSEFLAAYNNYAGANGVWVSGFFGSGKSHLLKMLALLLENREVDGAFALDMFLPKCGDNALLSADLKRAITIPSQSILFNIDQKADVISKTEFDALLAVFVKVFDETCGYYGKQAYIAQFERDLDKDGLLAQFQHEFEGVAGQPWDWGRSRPTRVAMQVDQAYNKITGQSQADVLDKYRQDFRLSIEDFAKNISDYVEQRGSDFRLNFFVDEIGQYIADNVKLMTNLQTLAESLATKCQGRAWIIVTAQEGMDLVIGEMEKQGDDFTKIQARFKNRMKLTSADVAEVIQKRLLQKTDDGSQQLAAIYQQQANNFKTLFDFADGGQSYRNYQDQEHFTNCYPFVPYQFVLFQSAIQNLSQHNAFEGRHSSVGERSMLGVFQQVAIQIGEHKVGQLATFDLMFEGIRAALKSNIQRAILQAERHLDAPFAIRILKALFLVKYVKEFKPSVRNLCVLMLDDFGQDMPGLRKRVEEALNLLEQQTYIQRNGEFYEFLTDEEKDVEQEIKDTEVETSAVATELVQIIFDQIIQHRKIRYNDPAGQQTQDYAFSRKLDDRLYGRDHELAINVISPFHEHAENEQMLINGSTFNSNELFVVLPADERLMRDLLMYKRAEKYINQNISVTQKESVQRILTDKLYQNSERLSALQQRVKFLMGKARLLVAGAEVELSTEDGQTRVMRGFQEVITRTYPNLAMLRGIAYTEDMIRSILENRGHTLFGTDATVLAESEQELLAFIQSNNRGGVRTTLKSLLERFECKPYGWPYAAVLCTLASIYTRGKIEVRQDGTLLESDKLERTLRNTQGHGNVVLEPQVEFTASQVRALKTFYEDFFDTPATSGEAKALGQATVAAFAAVTSELQELNLQASQFPFLAALRPVLDTLKEVTGKPYTWYLTELDKQEDRILDLKESIIDPIRKFMNGPQKDIYNQARNLLVTQEANFLYISNNDSEQISTLLNAPDCYKGNRIQQLKGQLDSLQAQIDDKVTETKETAVATLTTMQQRMHGMAEYQALPEPRQTELDKPFRDMLQSIEQERLIAVIKDRIRYFEEDGFQRLMKQMLVLTGRGATPPASAGSDAPENSGDVSDTRTPAYVHIRRLQVSYDRPVLESEDDVARYLDSLRESLLKQIGQGRTVQI